MRPLTIISPIHKAQRQLHLSLSEKCLAVGVPGNEGHVLAFVAFFGPCKVGDLAHVFGYQRSTLTGILDRLERAGLITRRTDPDDRRSFLVEVTKEGNRLGRAARRVVEDFEQEILDKVSERDVKGFRTVLEALAEVAGVPVHPREIHQRGKKK